MCKVQTVPVKSSRANCREKPEPTLGNCFHLGQAQAGDVRRGKGKGQQNSYREGDA